MATVPPWVFDDTDSVPKWVRRGFACVSEPIPGTVVGFARKQTIIAETLDEAKEKADEHLRSIGIDFDEQDANRYRFLASLHEKCAVYLEHNDFAASYRTAKQELDEDVLGVYSDVSEEMRAKMIEANSIWSLQIYPNTPAGFNIYHGSTLDEAIDLAMEDG